MQELRRPLCGAHVVDKNFLVCSLMHPITEGSTPVEVQLYVSVMMDHPLGVTIIICIDLQLLYNALRPVAVDFTFTHCIYIFYVFFNVIRRRSTSRHLVFVDIHVLVHLA